MKQVEWRKQYRKYKPLRQPATCNDCHQKTVTAAYHKICPPCARERRVCAFCCTKGRPRAEDSSTVDNDGGDDDDDRKEGEDDEEFDSEGDARSGRAGGAEVGEGAGARAGSLAQDDSGCADREGRPWGEEKSDDGAGSGGVKNGTATEMELEERAVGKEHEYK